MNLVSIIIPVYKVEAYIQQCIRSILQQTYKAIEIILVDDCGGDNSMMIAESLLQDSTISWRTVHHTLNKGLSAARNTGAAAASGEYIFFLDSDDYLSPNALELLANKAQETHANIVFGNIVYDTKGTYHPCMWTRLENAPAPADPLHAHFCRMAFPMACNKLIHREFYEKSGVRFIEGILHEDEPWSLSLILQAHKIAFVQDITYYYRQRPGAITANKRSDAHRLDGQYFWLAHASAEADAHQLHQRADFNEWFTNGVLNFLYNVNEGAINHADKLTYYNKVFTNLHLPDDFFCKNKLLRGCQSLSFMLRHYRWVNLYIFLRKLRDMFR